MKVFLPGFWSLKAFGRKGRRSLGALPAFALLAAPEVHQFQNKGLMALTNSLGSPDRKFALRGLGSKKRTPNMTASKTGHNWQVPSPLYPDPPTSHHLPRLPNGRRLSKYPPRRRPSLYIVSFFSPVSMAQTPHKPEDLLDKWGSISTTQLKGPRTCARSSERAQCTPKSLITAAKQTLGASACSGNPSVLSACPMGRQNSAGAPSQQKEHIRQTCQSLSLYPNTPWDWNSKT